MDAVTVTTNDRAHIEGFVADELLMGSFDRIVVVDNASDDGLVLGTYLHGLFHNSPLRRAILRVIAERKGASLPPPGPDAARDAEYDKLALLVRAHLDLAPVYRAMGLEVSHAG